MPWKTLKDGRKIYITGHRESPWDTYEEKRKSTITETTENDVSREWNNSSYERRKIMLANAGIQSKEEREYASHSSWDELNSSSQKKLLDIV